MARSLSCFAWPRIGTRRIGVGDAEPGEYGGGFALAHAKLNATSTSAKLENFEVLWRQRPTGKGGQAGGPERKWIVPVALAVAGLVVVGLVAVPLMRRKPEMVKFVRDMDAAGKTVAAICHAGWMLVSAGIVKDRPLTGFHSIKDDLVAAGARYQDSPVVVDRNLVTSRMPADLPDFCRTIIGQLAKKPAAVAS